MRETELYDLSDDADYAAASVYQSSASVSSRDVSKRNDSSSETDGRGGSQLVYLKDNVAIHPTQYASERITGRLKLIKQGTSLFMTWIPYQGQRSNARVSENDRNLYTIRAVPFTDIRSIRKHTPTIGWQYVIVVTSSGLAFAPLYFYNGGVRDFLATIKKHVHLVRSAEDTNVFLVNDFQDPLQRTLSSLEIPLAVANGPSPSFSTSVSFSTNKEKTNETLIGNQKNGRQRQKNHDAARDLSIQVLEKFSLVTRFARETTNQIFGENSDVFGSSEKRNRNQSTHVHPHNVAANDVEVPTEIPRVPDPLEKAQCRKQNHDKEAVTAVGNFELVNSKEVNKLTLVWGKPRQPPLGPEEWTTFLDFEGRVVDAKALRRRIFYGGVGHSLRKEVWAFLLGYHAADSTYEEREYRVLVKKLEYERLKNQWKSISAEQAKRFTKFRERKGLIEKDVVRTDRSLSFYEGDDNPNVILLHDILLTYSFFNFDLGYCQILGRALGGKICRATSGWDIGVTKVQLSSSSKLFSSLKMPAFLSVIECHRDEVWELPPQVEVVAWSEKTGVEMFKYGDHIMGIQGHPEYTKDILLHLIDRLLQRNFILGMSDLLSPILFVMKNESEAFWCFVSLMERLGPNFNRDQNGMHSQLFALSKLVELLDSPLHEYFEQHDCLNYFFCFRWILIQFKREFEYERTLRLWEVLWTHYLSDHLHLYVCVAILKKYRIKIMGEGMDFDTLLKFINELSGQIDLDAILRDAEALCICAGENGAASIPPGTPPSLPIEDGSLLYQQDDEGVL